MVGLAPSTKEICRERHRGSKKPRSIRHKPRGFIWDVPIAMFAFLGRQGSCSEAL